MSEPTLYERLLAAGAPPPRPRPPRASAAVILWRRDGEGRIEVFWLRRAKSMRFMGGWYAFPGGGLARGDREITLSSLPSGVDEGPVDAGMPAALLDGVETLEPVMPPGLAGCLVRELFEETGVLPLATAPDAAELAALAQDRRRLLAGGGGGFGELLAGRRLELDLSRLVYAGRWLTPPLGPLRFDNRFFLLEWERRSAWQPAVLPGEAEFGEWVRPAEALGRWRDGALLAAPPIVHLLTVLAEDGPERGLARMREPDEANLGPHRKIEFSPGVVLFALPTPTLPPASRTNTYLLGSGGEAVLVDPGSPLEPELERLEEALAAAERRLDRRVRAIWLTHHHPDHVGGVERLRTHLGCPVLCHPVAAERLAASGLKIDGHLADGQKTDLGGDLRFDLRVVHTPGHARGHLCFFEENRRVLVAGDMVAGYGTIVIDPPEGNMDEYLASLERLRELRPTVLFPAHGPVLQDGEAYLSAYLRHRRWREGRVLEAWRRGLRRPGEMLAEVYPDLAPEARPLAERQVVAHLERLRRAGELPGVGQGADAAG